MPPTNVDYNFPSLALFLPPVLEEARVRGICFFCGWELKHIDGHKNINKIIPKPAVSGQDISPNSLAFVWKGRPLRACEEPFPLKDGPWKGCHHSLWRDYFDLL